MNPPLNGLTKMNFKQFLIYKFKFKFSFLIIQLINFLILLQISLVNSASLILKPPSKCGDPGVPSFGRLLTNNLITSSSNQFFARSSPPNLITSQNDLIVSNNSEISIDILNFNNLDQNEISYEQGEIVSYSCFVGHLMIGSAYRKCLPSGRWSGNLPVCDTLLDQFDLMKSVDSTNQSNSDNFNHSSNPDQLISALTAQSVNYLKFSPPELAIDHRFSTCFHSEKYGLRMLRLNLNKSMNIIGVAITIPKENLDYDFSVYISNSKQNMGKGRLCLTFRGTFATKTTILLCQTTIQGDRINIEDNSKQIQTFSICEVQIYIEKEEIDCGEPEKPLNGLIVSRTRSGQIEYQCKLGYYLTGSAIRQCQKNGLYSGEQAVCNEIQCKEENYNIGIEDQQLELQITSQLHSLQLNCEPGYQFVGIRNHSIVCLGDGRFDTKIVPLCESIDCGSPLYISEQVNGEFIPLVANRTNFGSIAKLKCFDGVYSSENVLINCESSGQWSAPKAICIPDPLRANGHTRELKNRLGTLIVSVLLILVLLILLLTIYLFKKRILLLAMNLNENKLTEVNLRRNVHLISTNNGGVINNPNLVNNPINPELCLDVDSSSNSENNSSSQPSSKISIQRLFKRNANSTRDDNAQTGKFLNDLMNKLLNLKRCVKTSKLSNYVNCFNRTTTELNSQTDQYRITNQFLNSQLNPVFIDQLDCQDTSIKECAFRQYSSTLKHNQPISLVRLQNAQRAARLINASRYQFNQFDQINHFTRHHLITSSMKSDSLLISTRRQLVRDELIRKIKRPNRIEGHLNEINPSGQFTVNRQQTELKNTENSSKIEDEESKQFYYFAQHCFTLPQNYSHKTKTKRHQIDRLIKTNAFDKSDLNSDTVSNTSDSSKSSNKSENSATKNDLSAKSSFKFVNGEIEAKQKATKQSTITTVDIHLNKKLKNSSNKSQSDGQNSSITEELMDKSVENQTNCKSNKLTELNLKSSNSDSRMPNIDSNLKYIVIDDNVFAD